MDYLKWLLAVVAGVVLLLFFLAIGVAGYYTLWIEGAPKPDAMPSIVSYFLSAVNGILAANLGAVLGIKIAKGSFRKAWSSIEKMQLIAAVWYLLMILLTIVLWGLAGFEEDHTRVVSALPDISKTGIGIFIAILAAVLGVQTIMARRGPGGEPT